MWVDPDDDPRNSGGVSPDGELATLQDAMGVDIFGSLKRMLPFSRNDYWELSELKERLARKPNGKP